MSTPLRTLARHLPSALLMVGICTACLLACIGPEPVKSTPGVVPECPEPPASTFTQQGISLSVAKAGLKGFDAEGVVVELTPEVIELGTAAQRDARILDYLRCVLQHRDGRSAEQIAWYDQLWAHAAQGPTAQETAQWQSEHPFPMSVPRTRPNPISRATFTILKSTKFRSMPINGSVWIETLEEQQQLARTGPLEQASISTRLPNEDYRATFFVEPATIQSSSAPRRLQLYVEFMRESSWDFSLQLDFEVAVTFVGGRVERWYGSRTFGTLENGQKVHRFRIPLTEGVSELADMPGF